MVHLTEETLSELLDGESVAGAGEHLSSCSVCQDELEALRQLRAELRELPDLGAPEDLWMRIEAGLPGSRRGWRAGLRGPRLVALQAVAAAAVFVIGLGLGRAMWSDGPGSEAGVGAVAASRPSAMTLTEAMAEVQRRGADYDEALQNLERLARQEGAPVPSLAQQRLVGLQMLVEASRTALSVEPADPVLNSYLFAAVEERDAMLRELNEVQGPGEQVLWR
ncbi:MAG: hypothetical protein JSU87_10205 [Gemmatimonadota bacterium]|nr:MAG: hypothetical protein JSU87_10205 [Gemmatimonadota bacterium]